MNQQDIYAIMEMLPHRYPLLLVDRVEDLKPNEYIHAYKNVSINEPFFQGHFPSKPVMPGMLIVEGIAQAAGIMVLCNMEEKVLFYLASLEKVKFRQVVTPGDQLHYKVKCEQIRAASIKIYGQAFVGEKLVCEAKILCVAQ